jgi:pSer/pThr/pTyr-binding forkhead associated (FHA) protein
MRARLLPLDGGSPVEITRELTVVGRKEECDVRLDHKSVSKMHCVLIKTDGLLLLRDLGSTNGTRVNGQRVRRAALLPNDQITIASFKFRVYLGPDGGGEDGSAHTQQLEGEDLDRFLKRHQLPRHAERNGGEKSELIHRNQLPDVYPDDAQPGDLDD